MAELQLKNAVAIILGSRDNTSHFWHRATPWAVAQQALPADPRSTPLWIIRVSIPTTGLAVPRSTCCSHVIYNVAEESCMFSEERLEKKGNNRDQ